MHNGSLRYRITRLIDGSRQPTAVGRFRQKLVGAQLPQLLLTHVKQVAHSFNDRTRAIDRPTTVISRLHQFSPPIELEFLWRQLRISCRVLLILFITRRYRQLFNGQKIYEQAIFWWLRTYQCDKL